MKIHIPLFNGDIPVEQYLNTSLASFWIEEERDWGDWNDAVEQLELELRR